MAVVGSSAYNSSAQPKYDNKDIEYGILALIHSKDMSNSLAPQSSHKSTEKNIMVNSFYTH